MDFAFIGGLVVTVAAVLWTQNHEGGSLTDILLVGPLVLVIIGTIGVGVMGGTLKDAAGTIKQVKKAFLGKPKNAGETVGTIVKMAERARREGLLALEDAIKEVDDEFLRNGLQTAIDGTDPDELYEILTAQIQAKKAADKQGAKIFGDMGGYAPSVGICGTVISLTVVLANLSDAAALGPMIAGAFVATFWGVASANILYLPMQSRLTRLSALETAQMELVVEGILAIQAGSNPRSVAKKLESLLPPGTTVPDAKAA
ncbi:chemotaxis protein MotA [Kineococcus radiotolerans]|jgi:chemotaxis protein MotA|uniref:MotA/TolQ/ExbB proton channel n=2 Tax=Kineococcus radiotolerans TaxID=131568 RepID=A6W8K7_KINRD|nr:MotA/TolQ/ExbB proton channel family protein [Kineococcus radiotolerans]ABS03146.1 MotA/TolQ/ExbB proton channel [Kineococcus radiotolerans SRS30216 = ATCC BAA-149]MBB2899643.1 chemotaxis protein MotA [Kineococcus radiotolerans]